ncbi:hypothetical protein J4E93_006368 [Alternaria ventricosa]|uniref:uncharacterized protein n=1 Tax=Alternaria ventricosa TaxID=1187951 RepID=UPI0020C52317|nr:uncharacterized protein J4E93_006368 [Alternaria ventricosa]KAI4644465.1 hypothetical protein J4E93_006368 [Alternaria ventricosa]
MAEVAGWGTPSSLLKVLEKDSEILRSLLSEFSYMAREAQFRLLCFWEENDSDLVNYLVKGITWLKSKERIVDQSSATIESFDSISLMSDHFQLNKFPGPKDGNFTSVSDEIRETANKADSIIKTRQNMLRQSQVDDRTYHSMMDALGKGFADVEAAVKGTYTGAKGTKSSSVLEIENFQTWKNSNASPILWIHGKAGTGQGAIASSALELLRNAQANNSMIISFFCDQGDTMRRSLKGLLQMAVRQMIDMDQDLARHLLSDSRSSKDAGKQSFDTEEILKVPALWIALHKMARDLPNTKIYIVVYGVEQLAEESLEQFLRYMSETLETEGTTNDEEECQPVRWLLLNRSGRPNIEKCLRPRSLEINLSDAENSAQISDDLKAHISNSVDELDLPRSLAYFVKRHIYSRAEDNWIYVSLVVQEVKNAWVPGSTQHAQIRRLLESFPYGLTDMFEHVRKRVLNPQAEGHEYTKEILRCRISAYVAPTMRELAIMAELPQQHRNDVDKLKAYIVRCGAFFTLRGNDWDLDNSTVEWIDISAQEHLRQYAKNDLSLDLDDVQHGIIALRSLEYIYDAVKHQDIAEHELEDENEDQEEEKEEEEPAEDLEVEAEEATDTTEADSKSVHDSASQQSEQDENDQQDEDDEDEEEDEADSSSVGEENQDEGLLDVDLRYPVRYWVEHAKRAPPDVLEEIDFDHSFWQEASDARQRWWKTIEEVHNMTDQKDVSPLHVAVILEFPALVDHILSHRETVDVHLQDSLGFQPLYYACDGGCGEIVNALLGAGADIDFSSSSANPTALHAASRNGHYDVVSTLLDREADVNASSSDHGTALYAAAGNLENRVVKLLLDRNADVNVIGGPGRRALNVAAFSGNTEAVRLLIERGASIDPNEEYFYGSALGAAARRGHADVVRHLLSQSWNLSRPMKTYGSFLNAAATYNHLEVFEILLEKEERVLVLEQALQAAAQRGYDAIVKAVLEKESKVPSCIIRYQRAFSLAAFYGRTEVLKLLHPKGIDQTQLDEALYQATDNEHLETVKLLLDFGANPDTEGPTYGFALAASAYDGTADIMKALLDKGANVNKRGGDYGTCIQAAAWHGDADNVRLLLERGAELNTEPIGYYGTELQAAVHTGDEDTIRLLIEEGADVNAFGGHFSYAIVAAVEQGDSTATKILGEGDEECCEVLLQAGADVNAVGGPYGTPLQAAAWAEDMESVQVLLKAGADISITEPISGEYGSALQAACAAGSFDIVKELLQHGAAVNIRPANGKFGGALSAAAAGGFDKLVKLLIKHHADVNASGGLHGFPILAAAQSGVLPVVQRLLDNGANASALGGILGSTVAAAAYGNDLEIMRLLIEHGADVHAKGGKYGDALQTAAMKADMAIIEELLDRAIELVNHHDGKYHTALVAASYFNRMEVVVKLLDAGADFRVQGGMYRSAISAAAIRGNKTILDKFLAMKPPDHLLDEAFVEACAYRQSACVDVLLKAGANVYARHPNRGSATEALDISEEEDENSDLDDDDDEDEEEDSDDEEEEETDDDEWEGDDISVAGQTDAGSVTDVELEEELPEEAKIRKLLREAQDRCKRNPTVKRFRTVKHQEIPPSLSVGINRRRPVPPLPSQAVRESTTHSDEKEVIPPHSQHSQETWSMPFHLRSGMIDAAPVQHAQPAPEVPFSSYASNPASGPAAGKVQSPPLSSERMRSSIDDRQRQDSASSLPSQRHSSIGSIASVSQLDSTTMRKGSADHGLKRNSKAVNRKSVANLEAVNRYHQQRQSSYSKPTPPLDRSISERDYAAQVTAVQSGATVDVSRSIAGTPATVLAVYIAAAPSSTAIIHALFAYKCSFFSGFEAEQSVYEYR